MVDATNIEALVQKHKAKAEKKAEAEVEPTPMVDEQVIQF